MIKQVAFFVSTFFYTGMSPKAPGTVGSLASLILLYPIGSIYGLRGIIIGIIAVFTIGYLSTAITLRYTIPDPGFIVIDEVLGMFVTMLLPAIIMPASLKHIYLYLLAFVIFRVFDILKPLHIGEIDRRLGGAAGVMLDDALAGIYATVVLLLTYLIINSLYK